MSTHHSWRLVLAISLVVASMGSAAEEQASNKPGTEGSKPAAVAHAKKSPKTKAPAKPRVLVTISKATTYITEPLRPDGYPDYLTALNQRMSKGMTAENNAAVPFWKAMGPGAIPSRCRERYFRMIGIPPPPEKGEHFVTSNALMMMRHESKSGAEVAAPQEVLLDQMGIALKCPWSKQKFPFWAEWLQVNEKPIALLAEACRRPRRYEPLISGDDKAGILIASLLPGAQESREAARAFAMRAMLRVGEGKIDEAWSDLMDCHRIARLCDEGAFFVDGLVAISIDGMAQAGDRALLQYGKLTAAQIAKMRGDLAKLRGMSATADRLDLAERFSLLDATSAVARGGPSCLGNLATFDTSGNPKSVIGSLTDSLLVSAVDWDIPLRIVNSWYDRTVAVARMPNRAERGKETSKFEKDIRAMAERVKDPKSFSLSLLGNPRRAISERVGQMLVSLLFPAFQGALAAEDRQAMQRDITGLAFALAAYRVEHGSYPTMLGELVPHYMNEVPKDIFNNHANLHYTLQGGGYLLYSVGINGEDDGGKGEEECKNREGWDDLAVRMPAAKP